MKSIYKVGMSGALLFSCRIDQSSCQITISLLQGILHVELSKVRIELPRSETSL